jgi:undecaprenyl-diphosphatase
MAIEQIFAQIVSHKLIYIIIFLIILLEAVPPIGIFIPGQIFIMLAGFAAHQKLLNLEYLIVLAAIAAILGDWISYEIGKKYGLSFLKRYGKYFFLKEEYIRKSEKFMHNHLSKAIITGRLHSLTRVFVPFLAGVHKVRFGKFIRATIVGAIIWSAGSIMIGYIFGEGYRVVERYAGWLFIGFILASVAIYYLYHFLTIKKRLIAKWEFFMLVGMALLIILFSTIVEDIGGAGLWAVADKAVNSFIPSIQTQALLKLSAAIGALFSAQMVVLYAIAITLYLLFKKTSKEYLLFGSTMLLGAFLIFIIKRIIHRSRPEMPYFIETGFSFPSGHALVAMLFFGLIIYFSLKSKKPNVARYSSIIFCILSIIVVSASRIYIGVHWFSDVIGGLALGFVILSISLILARVRERRLLAA